MVAVLLALFLVGCAVTGDHLSPPTLMKLSRLQGRLEAQLAVRCATAKPPPECAELKAASTAFDLIAASSLESSGLNPTQVQQFLDVLLGLAGKAGGLAALGL